jgi:hypothetical protein
MITCPACKHREFIGTLFCSECATPLVHDASISTVHIPREEIDLPKEAEPVTASRMPALEPDALAGLLVVDTNEIINLRARSSFTLGRAVSGQAVIPDVDLEPYGALQHGVSRIHAELSIEKDAFYIRDLCSANGTRKGGELLEPQAREQVENGDIIQLGSLRLQLIA